MNDLNGVTCPFCGEGVLNHEVRDQEYSYKGHFLLIKQPGTYCSCCEEAILSPDDLKSNRKDLQAFRSRVDGLLEPSQIQKIRKTLGLTQKDAADVFGGGHNAFSRYERGEIPPPKSLSLLLSVLDVHKDIRADVIGAGHKIKHG